MRRVQQGFVGGEVSPQLFGRFDDVKFQNGLETCLNFLCLPQGPIERRPGFEFVREVKDSTKKVRLIPFVFNNSQTMVIELGDQYARFHTQGATLLGGDGNPYEIATPWDEQDLFDLHYVQSADVMTIVHPRHAPRELKRYSATDWRIETINFGSAVSVPQNVKAIRKTEAADDANSDKYFFKYKVSALTADKTAESKASSTVEVKANLYAFGTTVEVSCDAVPGAKYYRFYKSQGGLFGYIGDSETPSIIDDNISPDVSITPRNYDESFSDAGGITSVTIANGGSGYLSEGSVGDYVGQFTPVRMAQIRERDGAVVADNIDIQKYLSSLSWSFIASSEYNYPAYPTPDFNEINTKYIRIFDDISSGSGATVEGVFETSYAHDIYSGGGTEGQDNYIYYSITIVRLVGIRVISRGEGYYRPRIEVTGTTLSRGTYIYRAWYDLPVMQTNVSLDVQDSTGSGAILVPTVKNGKITSVRIEQGGRGYTNPKVVVRATQGSGASFSVTVGATGNYPTAVGYFEQRRCFAGLANDPQRVVMTRSATESDVSYSLPVQDDDRISVRISSREFNQIRHIIPLAQLLLLTSGSEMRVSPLNSDAITPTSFSVRPQSYVGASMVQPCIVNTTVVYPAARGGHVLELGYNYSAGGYISGDLCLRAPHLFDFKEIKDMTLSKAPTPILWFVSSDGSLLGLTYIPEQKVDAWHRHTTDGAFESVASVPEGDEDHLYAVVRRNVNGRTVRFIERMADRQFGRLEEAFFVDCGATYRGVPVNEVSGLSWLEGKEVHILADGAVKPPCVVTDGKIAIDTDASVIHIGLPYTSDAKTPPAFVAVQDNSYGMGHMKNINEVWARVHNTSGFFAGPTFEELSEYKQRTTEPYGSPPEMMDKELELSLFANWSDTGAVCIRQAYPLPMTVVSLCYELAS